MDRQLKYFVRTGCVLLTCVALAACTRGLESGDATPDLAPHSARSSVAVGTKEAEPSLRACASLIGSPTYAATRALAVTCSLGAPTASDIEVKPLTCLDGSPFYVFYSTSPTATDYDIYYGSEAGPLYSTVPKRYDPTVAQRRACS